MSLIPKALGLRLKIIAALALVAVVTAVSAGYFTIRSSYEALKHQKQQDELVIARNIAAQVDEVLRKAKQTVETLADNPAIRSMDPDKQREALTLVTKVTELIDGIAVSDLNGKVLVMDQTEPRTEALLPKEVFRYFVAPIRRRATAQYSQIFPSRSGQVVAPINAPIMRDGELVGVLSGMILLKNHTLGGIEAIRVGASGYSYLVDTQGSVLVHPQRQKVFENFRENPAVRELLSRREGVIEFINSDGVPVLAAFSPVDETGWGVVVRQPTAESYAYAHRMVYFLVFVFFVSLVIAVALGVALARKISGPVVDLVNGVKRVTDGSLDTQIPISSGDEIGNLARAFNTMTRRLKAHQEQTEHAHRRVLDTQKQLFQSEKLAAIGQLAAGLAHEVNNPLNIISGFNEVLLEQTPHPDPRRQHLEEISRETTRCQRLVAELLHFAKPKEPERRPTDLNLLVQETLSLIAAQAKSLVVELVFHKDDGMPLLNIDRDQIKQVLLNLSLNACQAMPEGGTLTIAAHCSGDVARLSIEDTGVGIAGPDLDNIFNPFYTTKETGTGLGLPLSFRLIERHQGKLEVRSEKGKGSTFTIELPVTEAVDAVPV